MPPEHALPHASHFFGSLGSHLEADLRTALRSEQFRVHWQPIVACTSGDLLGFEALIRWNRPGFGSMPPTTFVPAIEHLGLFREMDCWILQQACCAARQWPDQVVSVNVSARWFSGSGLVAAVATALERSGIDPARLELEVSEAAMVAAAGTAATNLARLKELGVCLSLDDFGSGYASLGYLHDLPFDKLKLDKAFISRLGHCRRTEAVVRAVLQLGASLDLTICAEGVERPEQLAILQAYGCDEVQGYLIGRPSKIVPDLLDFYDRLDRSMLFMAAASDNHATSL